MGTGSQLAADRLRRTDIRRILEAFHRRQPQGNSLFVFSTGRLWEQVTFVSPLRLLSPKDGSDRVRLWLRFLEVRPAEPYRTDLEVLSAIQIHPGADSEAVWERHQEVFNVQRVTERFFQDYREAFQRIREHLHRTHPDKPPEWTRDYTHLLLNRLMFLYFIQRKGWLNGPDGRPSRRFLREFWNAYREAVGGGRSAPDTFHSEWLPVLFFEAFNNRWQNRAEYAQRFPTWLQTALAQVPYLNGGLYIRNDTDAGLVAYLPDAFFELLFKRWADGTPPGLFERYNFTIVESGGRASGLLPCGLGEGKERGRLPFTPS